MGNATSNFANHIRRGISVALLAVGLAVCLGCGETAEDFTQRDHAFLQQLKAAIPLKTTLKENTRKKFEFHTMLVPHNWKSGSSVISLYNECDLSVTVTPGPCQDLQKMVDVLTGAIVPSRRELSRQRVNIAGREGISITLASINKVTGKPVKEKVYIATFHHDPKHNHMHAIDVRAETLEESFVELEPLLDEITNSIVSTL